MRIESCFPPIIESMCIKSSQTKLAAVSKSLQLCLTLGRIKEKQARARAAKEIYNY